MMMIRLRVDMLMHWHCPMTVLCTDGELTVMASWVLGIKQM